MLLYICFCVWREITTPGFKTCLVAVVLRELKPIYVGSCGLGLQPVVFLMLSYFSLVVGFIFCWNNLLKLAKWRSNEPWAGSKEGQGGGGKDGRALRQPDGFQVLGGDSEDVVDLFEIMSIIKDATVGRLVVIFHAMRPGGINWKSEEGLKIDISPCSPFSWGKGESTPAWTGRIKQGNSLQWTVLQTKNMLS